MSQANSFFRSFQRVNIKETIDKKLLWKSNWQGVSPLCWMILSQSVWSLPV